MEALIFYFAAVDAAKGLNDMLWLFLWLCLYLVVVWTIVNVPKRWSDIFKWSEWK